MEAVDRPAGRMDATVDGGWGGRHYELSGGVRSAIGGGLTGGELFVANAQIERLLGRTGVRCQSEMLSGRLALLGRGRRFGLDVVREGGAEGNGCGGCVGGVGTEVRLGDCGAVGVRRHWGVRRIGEGVVGHAGGIGIVLGGQRMVAVVVVQLWQRLLVLVVRLYGIVEFLFDEARGFVVGCGG